MMLHKRVSTGQPGLAQSSTRRAVLRPARLQPCRAQKDTQVKLQSFPATYDQAVRQCQEATQAAINDGKTLLEIEFPSTSLSSVMGDGEGQNEMNASMDYLRQFMGAFRGRASTTRIFFPDNVEARVARNGQTTDPSAGRKAMEPKFSDAIFQLGYLTRQNAMWAITGLSMSKFTPLSQVKPEDDMFVIAYPSFNPREELSAAYEIYTKAAKLRGAPLIIFNGELDRIRGGYYPGLFFPELAKLSKEFVPQMEQAYYIHNFKGTKPGALFRCYPGPWQVLRRNPFDPNDMRVVWTSDSMPTLKEVALEILPNSRA